jgi:hypothetical protein
MLNQRFSPQIVPQLKKKLLRIALLSKKNLQNICLKRIIFCFKKKLIVQWSWIKEVLSFKLTKLKKIVMQLNLSKLIT